jgi:hypothetical protein
MATLLRPPLRVPRPEILVGRSMAACLHPMAAWQSKTRSFRVLLVASYFAIGYVAVLTAIVLI